MDDAAGDQLALSQLRGEWKRAALVVAITGMLVLLYRLSGANYLLFHSVIELFSTSVLVAVIAMAWSARHWVRNDFLLFLGLAYFFVGVVDAMHALAFPGMGVFQSSGPDTTVQLAVLARCVEGVSLLAAPTFLRRRFPLPLMAVLYLAAVGGGLLSVLQWGVIPACVDEALQPTDFKLACNYGFFALLALTVVRLHNHKRELLLPVAKCLVGAVLLSAAAELALMALGPSLTAPNVLGHLLKGLSFYAVYCAVVEKGFREPSRRLLADLSNAVRDAERERDLARRYLDIAGVIILVLDSQGKVVLVNPKGADVLGCTPDEIVGMDFIATFVPAEERDRVAVDYHRLMAEGLGTCVRAEAPVVTLRGEQRIVSWRISVVADEAGVTGTLSSGKDITEQLRAAKMLAASEEKYRTLFLRSMDAISLIGPDGLLLDANPAFLALFGLRPGDVGTARVADFCLNHEDCVRALELGLQHEAGMETRLALKKADGSVMDCRVSVVPLRDEADTLVAYQSVVRDVTAETQAQTQLSESREQLRRLARRIEAAREEERTGIARELHDQLGQALTALKMDRGRVTRSLERGRAVEPDLLRQMAQLIGTTIQDVQRISSDLRPGILDDLGLVEAVKWQLSRFRERTRIACHYTSSIDGVGLNRSGSTALFRAFQELLTNIARHALARNVCVNVSGDSEVVTLTVSDDGRGITREQIEGRNSLGLIGIRERILAAGGNVEIHGSPGQGTTTRISLPLL